MQKTLHKEKKIQFKSNNINQVKKKLLTPVLLRKLHESLKK